MFDKIQIAGLQDVTERVTAHGGFDDRDRVFWETTREERIAFSQGVFNKSQFDLLANSKQLHRSEETILVPKRENCESNANGNIELSHTPIGQIFVYNKIYGVKMPFTQENNIIHIPYRYTEVVIDYNYVYEGTSDIFLLGSQYFNGYLSLEGMTRIKDDETGWTVTGMLIVPKLKLTSDLSIRLGAQANPIVANFSAVGVPVGSRGRSYISEFYWLDSDLLGD
jgi:hypothetical protein